MIPLSVSEIHCTRGFCDKQDEDEQELGVLVVGYAPPAGLMAGTGECGRGTIGKSLVPNPSSVRPKPLF